MDIEGWLFILITIVPLCSLSLAFKDHTYPPEIDNCPAEINDKQSMKNKRFNDHLI